MQIRNLLKNLLLIKKKKKISKKNILINIFFKIIKILLHWKNLSNSNETKFENKSNLKKLYRYSM